MKLNIIHDGEIPVNYGVIVAQSDSLIAITIDLEAKYAEIFAICNTNEIPGIILSAGGRTIDIKEERAGAPTEIEFPEFKGLNIHCADISRYSLKICLIKPD